MIEKHGYFTRTNQPIGGFEAEVFHQFNFITYCQHFGKATVVARYRSESKYYYR